MIIKSIQEKISSNDYRLADHAVRRMIKRSIDRSEITEAIMNCEVIEEYPDDKYTPSCLLLGKTKTGRILHIQLSLPPSVVIITVYEPDPNEWIDFKKRRSF